MATAMVMSIPMTAFAEEVDTDCDAYTLEVYEQQLQKMNNNPETDFVVEDEISVTDELVGGNVVYSKSGVGNAELHDLSLPDGYYRIDVARSDDKGVYIKSYNTAGQYRYISPTFQRYSGSTSQDLIKPSDKYPLSGGYLKVEASGSWSFTISTLGTTNARNFKGACCAVSDYMYLNPGTYTATMNYSTWNPNNTTNFIVEVIPAAGIDTMYTAYLANAIVREYSNQKEYSIRKAGYYCLRVYCFGDWSIDLGMGGAPVQIGPSISPTPAPAPTPAPTPTPSPTPIQTTSKFVDVQNTSAYYYNPVIWAVNNNVTTGKSSTVFAPNEKCTRAQVVTFLWRAMGQPAPRGGSPFVDVSDPNAYYYKAVAWAAENNITTGKTPTTFAPNATVTRGEFVTFLYRAKGQPAVYGGCKFTDVPSGQYYTNPVIWAVNRNITTGRSATSFAPKAACTRAEVVTFIYRAFN